MTQLLMPESGRAGRTKDAAMARVARIFALRNFAAIVLLGALSSTVVRAQSAHAPSVITQVGRVHDLAPNFDRSTRVHLTGTITYYDPVDGIMFLQDSTGGIYVNTDKDYPVHNGDLVTLDGFAAPSYRTEVANDPSIHVIGRGTRYAAPDSTYPELVSGRGDCKLVTIRGKVRAADQEQHLNVERPSMHLDIMMPDGEVQVYIHPSVSVHPESLLDAEIQITGVAGGLFDAKNQLTGLVIYAPEAADVKILQRPDVSARQLPLTPIDEVFSSFRTTDASRPIRVRGTITYYTKGDSAVLERDGKSIFVQTRGTTDLSVGDEADAIGFATNREYAPSLRQASLVRTGRKETIVPRPISFAEAASGRYSDNLVSLEGTLVSQLQDGDSYSLVINVDGHLVNGHLKHSGAVIDHALGSRLRITGICRIVAGGAWRSPYLSHIEMRETDDIVLISSPSWLTVQHLFELLGVLGLMALAVGVWAALLKRRVASQTAWIDRSVTIASERSRILEKISSNHSLEEMLTEICASTMGLLPKTTCVYSVRSGVLTRGQNPLLSSVDSAHSSVLFEVPLRDAGDEVIGKVILSAENEHAPTADSHEIYEMLSELSSLATRQWLLYQGLVHHSTHDPLTELPNRRLCESTLTNALRQAEVDGGQLAVIYIDINHFKHVNDKFGHKTGDLYLQEISHRLRSQIRGVDMLARIGGDEFVIIAPFPEGFDRSYALVARLEACFTEPFNLEGKIVDGSASIGFARYPEHGSTAEELTRHADHAMYIAKRREARASGDAHGVAIITPDELEVALLHGRFRLAYQPQFSAAGRLTGLEALIRLDDPVLGIVTPDAFISVAEQHPVIVGIGAWVLRTALQDANRWKLNSGEPMTIAVNASVRQLEEPDYADSVLACLAEHAFPAERLEIELIERSLMFTGEVVSQQLRKLRAAGVRIALDDFGTGQSCLSLLHKLPIDTIKLDRGFIRAMDDEPEVLPVIQAIVTMAHSLGKRVVAEAIEHVGPVPTLLKMGQMDFQGYLLSRPVASREIGSLIQIWRAGIEMPDAFRHENKNLRVIDLPVKGPVRATGR